MESADNAASRNSRTVRAKLSEKTQNRLCASNDSAVWFLEFDDAPLQPELLQQSGEIL